MELEPIFLRLPILFKEKDLFGDLFIIKQNDMFDIWQKYNEIFDYRFNYNLNENSIVFDLGGFKGEWSNKIYTLYKPNIHLFEICKDYFIDLVSFFMYNEKIKLNNFGLSDCNKELELFQNGDKTTVFFNKELIEDNNTIKKSKFVDFFNYIENNDINHIDLMKINIEGGEYDLMDYILKTDFITKITDIQIQFHNTVKNHLKRMIDIQTKLRNTHYQSYCFPTIWENWRIKDDSKIFIG